MQTLGEALSEAIARLSASPGTNTATGSCTSTPATERAGTGANVMDGALDNPRLEAELLLCEVADTNRTGLLAWPERPLTAAQAERYRRLVARRARGEPIAYILGRREFWGLQLQVAPATLIPRADTELLIECALRSLPADEPLVCADLGSGSGAIAAALASERPAWTVLAIERCAGAAAIAAANARRLGLDQVLVVQTDWLRAIAPGSLGAIVGNPPYVREDDPHLEIGDLRFEPRTALTAGADGLDAIREIVASAPSRLRARGWIAIEHGWDQGGPVRGLLRQAGFDRVQTDRDLAGHERVSSGIAAASKVRRDGSMATPLVMPDESPSHRP